MFPGNFEMLRSKVEAFHFAVMKIVGKPFLKINRTLIETVRMDESGQIWASVKDSLPKLLISPQGFNVNLRYANKEDETYLQVKGKAFIEEYFESVTDKPDSGKVSFTKEKEILLRIEVESADFFRKKVLSKYTSMLQNIWSFSVGKLISSSTLPARNKIA